MARIAAKSRDSRVEILKRLSCAIDCRNTLLGQEDFRQPARRGDLAADFLAELGVFVRRGPHQRDRRVMDVKLAAFELRGNRIAGAEIDHVERADRNELRNPAARPR